MNDVEDRFAVWRYLLAAVVGACAVLLTTAVNPFPNTPDGMIFYTPWGWLNNPIFGGWLWACLLTIGFSAGCGLSVLVGGRRRFATRLYLALGFFTTAWLSALAFAIRWELWFVNPFSIGVFLLPAAVPLVLWLLCLRHDQREALFP